MRLRIAHFSDLHYANDTLAEVDPCFTHAVNEAIGRKVDVAVITGDSTDHALSVHAPAFTALARQIRRLADHCPVLMLQGTYSHEPVGTLDIFPLLGGHHPIHVADRICQVALTTAGRWVASASWCFETPPECSRLLCSCVPTLNKAALAAAVGAADAATAMGEELALVLKGFAPSNQAACLHGIPTIGLSHGTVSGCLTEHGVPMAGLDHEFTAGALFSAQASAFMLGHIHRHQAWQHAGRAIAYPGAIGRLHYGEQGEKGFLLWEVGAQVASMTLVPTPARRTHEISFDGAPDMALLQQFVQEQTIEGAWIRVRWQLAENMRDQVDREAIARLFQGAAGIKLEGRVIPTVRARAAGISREASLRRQLAHWAEVTGTQAEPLFDCLDLLAQQSPEEIASRILRGDTPSPVGAAPLPLEHCETPACPVLDT